MPIPLSGHCVAAIDGGTKFFIAGGSVDLTDVSDRAFIFDLNDPEAGWLEVQPMSEGKDSIDCIQMGNDVIVPAGSLVDYSLTSTVLAYDILADVWRQIASLPEPRSGYRLAKFSESGFHLIGGYDGDEYPERNLEFDSEKGSWRTSDIVLNTPRAAPIVELLPGNSIHLPSC